MSVAHRRTRLGLACAATLMLAVTACNDGGASRPSTSGPVGHLVSPSANLTPLPFRVGTAVPGGPCISAQLLNDQTGLVDPKQLNDARYYPPGYHWKIDSALSEASIGNVAVSADSGGGAALTVSFTAAGAAEWQKLTTAAFNRGASSPLNRVAIFLGDEVISAPAVLSPSSDQTTIVGDSATQVARWAAQITAAIHDAPVPLPPPPSPAACG